MHKQDDLDVMLGLIKISDMVQVGKLKWIGDLPEVVIDIQQLLEKKP